MLVAGAVCPHPPLLIPAALGAAAGDPPAELRKVAAAAARAVAGLAAAGVPGRVEYWNVNAPANLACRTVSRVSAKSRSVSPGKPTMMSVVMAAPGMAARTCSRMPRYRSWR